jgi:hypothetical protein
MIYHKHVIQHLAKFHLNELSNVCLKKQFVDKKCDCIPTFFFFFLMSNRNIIKKQKAQSRYTRSIQEKLPARRRKKELSKLGKTNAAL